jgi:adenylate kinase family enzyme
VLVPVTIDKISHILYSQKCAMSTTCKSLSKLAREIFASESRAPPRVLFLLGAPGSGKGTICSRLDAAAATSPTIRVCTVSAGELLRAAAFDDRSVARALAAGHVVPPSISAGLVLGRLRQLAQGAPLRSDPDGRSWIAVVDGFPRSTASARAWEACGARVHGVLALEGGSYATLADRIVGRGRDDDLPAVFVRRFAHHAHAWRPLRAFYVQRKLWRPIDARDEPKVVWRRVYTSLQRHGALPTCNYANPVDAQVGRDT